MGEIFGRLITGTLWGLGAGLVMTFSKEGEVGLRKAAKAAMRGYVGAAEKIGEARESIDDLIAESRTEARPQATRPAPRAIPVERERPARPSTNGEAKTTNGARKSRAQSRAPKHA